MIPGQRLGTKTVEILRAQRIGRAPAPQLQLAITPVQSGRSDGTGPGLVGAIQRFKPGIHARAGPPGSLNHRSQAAIPTAHEVLHRRQTDIREVEAHPTQPAGGLPQQALPSLKFSGGNAVPLEGCMGLRREIADGDVEAQPPQISASLLKHHAGLGDAEDIGVGLARETDHEIELHLAVAVLHRRADAIQQVVIG